MVTTSGIQVIASTLSDGRSIVGARTLGGRTYESRPQTLPETCPDFPFDIHKRKLLSVTLSQTFGTGTVRIKKLTTLLQG